MPHDWVLLASPPLLAAAVADIGWRVIPNWVPLTLVAGFAVTALARGDALGLATALAVGAGTFLVGAALFAAGMMGGGDVKLAAAAAVWVGARGLLEFLVVMAILGGALALAILLARLWRRLTGARRPDAERGVPYGVAIAGAALWALAGP